MSFKLITRYGDLEWDDYKNNSHEIIETLQSYVDGATLFFADSYDLTENNDEDLNEEIFDMIIDEKFEYPERAKGLVEAMESDEPIILIELEQDNYMDNKAFSEGGDNGRSWYVYTEDEAEEQAVENTKNLLDDLSMFEVFNDDLVNTILENHELIDNEYFLEIQQSDNENYVDECEHEDITDEPTEGEYINRLHEELCQYGIMDDPEYPEEPDDENTDEWKEWKTEYDKYIENIRLECENKKEEYIEKRNEEYETGVEWYVDNFGDEMLKEFVKNNDLANNEAIAQWVFDHGYTDRGNELAGYDGQEVDADTTYGGERYYFYCYRTN